MTLFRLSLLALVLAASPVLAQTAPAPAKAVGAPGETAFVEHRLALQISDGSAEKQTLLLNNAFNVLTAFGPDKVAIEVVAYGPGLGLLAADNPNAARIRSLAAQGVVFDACMNTLEAIEKRTGKPYPLLADARRVPAGVVQLITLHEQGYTIIRP